MQGWTIIAVVAKGSPPFHRTPVVRHITLEICSGIVTLDGKSKILDTNMAQACRHARLLHALMASVFHPSLTNFENTW